MSLTFKTDGLAFIDVPAPYFGQDVVIRVNKKTVKSYVRSAALGDVIRNRTDIEQKDVTAYMISADMITLCTIPETGEPAFADSQIDDIVNLMPKELVEQFLTATFKLDPISLEQPVTLAAKKKKS